MGYTSRRSLLRQRSELLANTLTEHWRSREAANATSGEPRSEGAAERAALDGGDAA